MTNTQTDLLSNVLLLLALFASLAMYWFVRRGGRRGRIAERARQAALSQRTVHEERVEELREGSTRRFARHLASIGERIPLIDPKNRKELALVLLRAGFRGHRAMPVLVTIKCCAGVTSATLVALFGSHLPLVGGHLVMRAAVMGAAFIVGMIVPEFIVNFRSRRRRQSMSSCIPDALDLMVICTNAGNSLAVSIRRVANEMRLICPPLADEFSLTADELQLSGENTRALTNLAERIDLPSIRALIATLTQSMRYGTPITQALRTLSRTERLAHIVALEEKAAKLAPKMVIPMMLFILPAVVVIAGGPAVIQLMEVIQKK